LVDGLIKALDKADKLKGDLHGDLMTMPKATYGSDQYVTE
jgi:hypothetical protein